MIRNYYLWRDAVLPIYTLKRCTEEFSQITPRSFSLVSYLRDVLAVPWMQTAVLFKKLRKALDGQLAKKIKEPQLELVSEGVVPTIVQLLLDEESAHGK